MLICRYKKVKLHKAEKRTTKNQAKQFSELKWSWGELVFL